METNKSVKDYVHVNRNYGMSGQPNDPLRCQFSVYENDRVGSFHQCYRKLLEKIDGVGFCRQHGAEVKQRLGRSVAEKIRFAASFTHGEPKLFELEVVSETDATIEVKKSTTLIGNGYGGFSSGRQRKDSQYTRRYSFFDDKNKAIASLISGAELHVRSCQTQLESAILTHENLLKEWYKK